MIDISTWDTARDLRVYALPDGRGLYINGVAAIVTREPAIVGAEAAPSGLATGVNKWLAWPVIARGVRDAIVAVLPAPAPTAAKPDAEKCRVCDDTGETECECCDGQGTLHCGKPACGRFHECDTCDGTGRADCDCDTPPAKDEPIRSLRVGVVGERVAAGVNHPFHVDPHNGREVGHVGREGASEREAGQRRAAQESRRGQDAHKQRVQPVNQGTHRTVAGHQAGQAGGDQPLVAFRHNEAERVNRGAVLGHDGE
jgi:hypothetical protein